MWGFQEQIIRIPYGKEQISNKEEKAKTYPR